MEPNIFQIDKQLVEYIEFYHYLYDLNFEKMNVGDEVKLKEIIKFWEKLKILENLIISTSSVNK